MEARKCKATSKQSGKPCGRWATPGALVCPSHGSKAPQTAARGSERIAEQEARRTFGRLSEVSTPIDNPFDALAVLAGEVMAWKNFCAGRIAELESYRYEGQGSGEQLNAEIALFERALDRCVSTMTAIAKLNLDEKAVRVSEKQAMLMESAITAALADMGMDEDAQEEAAEHVVRHLRAAPAAS